MPNFEGKFSLRPGAPRWLRLGHQCYREKKASRASAKNIKSSNPATVDIHASNPDYNDRPVSDTFDTGTDNVLEAQ